MGVMLLGESPLYETGNFPVSAYQMIDHEREVQTRCTAEGRPTVSRKPVNVCVGSLGLITMLPAKANSALGCTLPQQLIQVFAKSAPNELSEIAPGDAIDCSSVTKCPIC